MLLTDATLVLADEPTAHLDPPHERRFLETLSQWAQRRTMVIASHRPAVFDVVTRVLTIDGGQVR